MDHRFFASALSRALVLSLSMAGSRLVERYSARNVVALDGLRGIAILGVMFFHFGAPDLAIPLVNRVVSAASRFGGAGVDLFFVLSGFLITGILVDTRECANYWRSFYCRRALRIFPLYYAFLLFAFLVFPLTVSPDWVPLRADWWMYPVYLTNWLALWKGHWPNILGHFWSLSVEEQFYLVWPFVVLFVKPRQLLWMLAIAEGIVLGGRALWLSYYTGWSDVINLATITRMDGLLFGAGCAVAVRRFRFSRLTVTTLPIVAVALLAAFVAINKLLGGQPFGVYLGQALDYALLSSAFAAVLLTVVLTDHAPTWLQRILRLRVLTQFGKYAYGLYVYHITFVYFVSRLGDRLVRSTQVASPWFVDLKICIGFALSYGVASLSYNYFEKRFLVLKERFRPEFVVATPSAYQSPIFGTEVNASQHEMIAETGRAASS
jgi:peptidoglycan/LPS O-acetylase OafA/YrhL